MGLRMLTDGPWSSIPLRRSPLAVEIPQWIVISLGGGGCDGGGGCGGGGGSGGCGGG